MTDTHYYIITCTRDEGCDWEHSSEVVAIGDAEAEAAWDAAADRLRAEAKAMQHKIRFRVLDKNDKHVATIYAETEVDALRQALSEGIDAWSAYDSLSRHSGGW